MAVGSGLSVASNYYVQPLLPDLADEFGVGSSTVSLLAAVALVLRLTDEGHGLGRPAGPTLRRWR